jgi:metal-responsive CopG/Arc/MetJ family transcriptional regulator
MASQMAVRVEEGLKDRFSRLVQSEGRNTSEVIRDLMARYVAEHDLAGYIDGLWSRVGRAMADTGATVGDVPRAIAEVRKAKP